MSHSIARICFVLGCVAFNEDCSIRFDCDMFNLANRLSNDPYYQFSDRDIELIEKAFELYNENILHLEGRTW